ncbi:type II toxin-antitoxin system VapC family toxin [Brevundimonas staleyi]|uniref:Type II toxin-antitoxin system VapC family toxin n=1 Tax=Brevundimonas staleyi TaxID=74326 RepID=A0ABW0FV17_9CAUL
MKFLLDTHALIWWVFGDERFPESLRPRIGDPESVIHVSAVSAMEITTKHRIGKLPGAVMLATEFQATVARLGFLELPLTVDEAVLAGRMLGAHKDPFDRMLIAQALRNDLILISNERLFDDFGVKRLW